MPIGQMFDKLFDKLTVNRVILFSLVLLVGSGLFTVWYAVAPGAPRAIAMLWCFACLSIGLLSGFLFAIPRVSSPRRSDRTDPPHGHESTGLGINTNLEEISDWLTKILVGIGLVEASKIRNYLGSLGVYVGSAFSANGSMIATGFIVLYLGLGFVSGFLITRLFISPSLRQADEATAGIDKAEKLAGEAKEKADATLQLYDVLDAAYSAWVDYHRVAAEKRAAERTLTGQSVQTAPQPIGTGVLPHQLAQSYIAEFRKFYDQPRWRTNRRLHLLMANFYYDLGDFPHAMAVLTHFIESKTEENEFDLHMAAALYNRACYHAALFSKAGDEATKASEKVAGLADLAKDVDICPSDAAQAKGDPDLAVWRDDPEFVRITTGYLS